MSEHNKENKEEVNVDNNTLNCTMENTEFTSNDLELEESKTEESKTEESKTIEDLIKENNQLLDLIKELNEEKLALNNIISSLKIDTRKLLEEKDKELDRRTKDLENKAKFANTSLLKDIVIPSIENLEIALRHIPENAEEIGMSNFIDGINSIYSNYLKDLEKYNIVRIGSIGEDSDPNKHEIISQAPSPDYEPGKVIHVQSFGYMLENRVIKPAQVVVSI